MSSAVIEPFIPPSPSTFLPRRDTAPPVLPPSPVNNQSGHGLDPGPGIFVYTSRKLNAAIPRRWWWNPYPTPFAPAFTPVFNPPKISLNNQLNYNQANIWSPPILWDVIHPVACARVRDHQFFRRWKDPKFEALAIHPGVQKVWVLTDHLALKYWMNRWGPIIIIKTHNITIRDVLEGIYSYLRTPLTRKDLTHINEVPDNRKRLRYARAQRARDSLEIESVVISQGYRRIDVVGGHRQFQGMRIDILPDRTWILYFGLLPGPIPRVV